MSVIFLNGRDGWIWTNESGSQSPMPYRLATPLYINIEAKVFHLYDLLWIMFATTIQRRIIFITFIAGNILLILARLSKFFIKVFPTSFLFSRHIVRLELTFPGELYTLRRPVLLDEYT